MGEGLDGSGSSEKTVAEERLVRTMVVFYLDHLEKILGEKAPPLDGILETALKRKDWDGFFRARWEEKIKPWVEGEIEEKTGWLRETPRAQELVQLFKQMALNRLVMKTTGLQTL